MGLERLAHHASGLFTVSVCVMSNFSKSRVLSLQVEGEILLIHLVKGGILLIHLVKGGTLLIHVVNGQASY